MSACCCLRSVNNDYLIEAQPTNAFSFGGIATTHTELRRMEVIRTGNAFKGIRWSINDHDCAIPSAAGSCGLTIPASFSTEEFHIQECYSNRWHYNQI
jgi:hypothetical protein